MAIFLCVSKINSGCNICYLITQILNTDYSDSWWVIIIFIVSILLISIFLLVHSKRIDLITKKLIERRIELEKFDKASDICNSIADTNIQHLIKSQLSLKLASIGESKYIDQDINDFIIKYNKFNTAFEKGSQGDADKSQQFKMHLLLNLCGIENSKEIIKGMYECAEKEANNKYIIALIDLIAKINDTKIKDQTYQLVLCNLLGVQDLKSFLKNSDDCKKQITEIGELIELIRSIDNNDKKDKTYKDILFYLQKMATKDNITLIDLIEEFRKIFKRNNQ